MSVGNKKEIYIFILLYCISRIFILFIPASIPDQVKIYDLQSFPNLTSFNTLNPVAPYPLLFSIQLATIFFLFGANMMGYRIGMMLYEVGTLVILYKFVLQFHVREYHKVIPKASRTAILSCYFLAFSPFIIYSYNGNPEYPAIFFMILGLYTYYNKRVALGSFFISIGCLTEFFPIFCFIPILINALLKKNLKNVVKIIGPLLVLFLAIHLPYFWTNPFSILASYSSQLSRTNTVSLWQLFPQSLLNLTIFNIQIGTVELVFLLFIVGYCIFVFHYFNKHRAASESQEFLIYIIFTLILPIIFLSIIGFYFLIGIPLLCLFFESKISFQKVRVFSSLIIAILIPFSIINIIFWPKVYLSTPPQGGFVPGTDVAGYVMYAFCFIAINVFLALYWFDFGKNVFLGRISYEFPTVFQLLCLSFLIYFMEIIAITLLPIFEIPVFILGIIPVIWSDRKLLKMLNNGHLKEMS